MRLKLVLLFSLFFLPGSLWAQVNLSASVDKNNLTLDDELTLTVQVTGVSGNIVMPQLPSLPAFNVYSREVEQSSINGNTTLLFRYVMLPRFVGNATIGAISFTHNGQTYKTEPIAVHIYRTSTNVPQAAVSTQAPAQKADPNLPPLEAALANLAYAKTGQPFFLVAAISNKTPYVNQPFTLAIRFYYSRAFHDAPYTKPTVSNLFLEDQDTREGSQNIGGTLYRYQEQRYQLTAAAPGKATIGPATVRYRTGSAALSAFDRIFGGATAGPERTVSSEPITLQARALPQDNKPDSFYGAVGHGYTLQAKAEPRQVQAGEAINVSVTVKGPGNLKATQNLDFPRLDGFKIYPAAATSGNTTSRTGLPQTYKTYKAVLVPTASGIYTLPALSWSYFDPQLATYKTLQTTPIQLTVTPATQADSGFNFAGGAPVNHGVETLGTDIAYLKTNRAPEENLLQLLSRWGQINWMSGLLVVLAVLFAGLGRKSFAKKKAFLTAKGQLKKPISAQQIADTLSLYLQQRLALSTASLPLREILTRLRQKGVTPATLESFSLLWQRLEAERFAPNGATTQTANLTTQAQSVLKLIEEEIQ